MSERSRENPKPAIDVTAASHNANQQPAATEPMRLWGVKTTTRRQVGSRFRIPWTGYIGYSSVLAAEQISTVAMDAGLETPTPAGLELHRDSASPTSFFGKPLKTDTQADLVVHWKSTKECSINFAAFLQTLQVTIPPDHNMLIDVESVTHPVHGPCIHLSWGKNCFVAIEEKAQGSTQGSAQGSTQGGAQGSTQGSN